MYLSMFNDRGRASADALSLGLQTKRIGEFMRGKQRWGTNLNSP